MQIIKQGAALILAGAWAIACAAPTGNSDGGDGDGDSTGPAVPGTGGTLGATGGATGVTGGATGVTGGTTGSTGGTTGSTGGTTGSTGGTANAGTPCAAGTVTATNPPTILAWETDDGSGVTTSTEGASATVDITGDEAFVNMTLSTWAASGRECVDVGAFQGIQFDLTTSAPDMILLAAVSASDPSGHCTDPTGCYAHPRVSTTAGTTVQVPFSSLAPATWGVMAPFTANQVIGFTWMSLAQTSGSITVSNVSFY